VIEIRDMNEADRPALVALWHAAGVARPWNDPDKDIAFARRGDHSTVLVGFDGASLVASAMVGEDGHRGWVYYVAVDPACQQRGLGKAMMMAAEAWLRARGVWKMQLMVRGGNEPVRAFYERLGYQLTDTVVLQKQIG
jgi:ribosomal protein S18 acetylase RimI-like enzyme